MNRLKIPYSTEQEWLDLRAEDLTSTVVSALFGCNPWLTEFELWHRMNSKQNAPFESNEAMDIGKEFEAPIAEYIAKKEGWTIQPKKYYMRLDCLGIGSSFDYEIIKPFQAVYEIKNVGERAYSEYWKEEGEDIQAPLYYEFQFQTELLVSGEDLLVAGLMVGGNRRRILKRVPDEKVHKAILEKCATFRKSLKDGIEPKPNFERDAAFIAKMFNKADKAKEICADSEVDDLVNQYHQCLHLEKTANAQKEIIKAKVLMKVGNVGKVTGSNYSISLSETKGSTYTTVRKPGRSFKIFFDKEKEKEIE